MSSSKPPLPEERWLGLARRYVRFGTRSIAQVRNYLAARGAAGPVIGRIITHALQRGWLDDRACARLQAGALAERGFSDAAIRQRLLAQGLDERVVGQALQRLRADSDDAARARRLVGHFLVRQRTGALRGRLTRRLARRGFDPELIEQVLLHTLPDVR